jgi:hypothetical protein
MAPKRGPWGPAIDAGNAFRTMNPVSRREGETQCGYPKVIHEIEDSRKCRAFALCFAARSAGSYSRSESSQANGFYSGNISPGGVPAIRDRQPGGRGLPRIRNPHWH